MRLLVTGANGFIGKHLIEYLRNIPEYTVTAVVGSSGTECLMQKESNVTYIKSDIAQESFVSTLFRQIEPCDVIIHLAACISGKNESELIGVNVTGTVHIAKLAALWEAKKVVYISSIPVIGHPMIHPVDEMHPLHPETLYHITKLTGEQILRVCCGQQAEVVSLRIPSPIGMGMNEKNFLSMLIEKCKNEDDIVLFGTGGRKQNYIDVRDVCRAIVQAVEKSADGIFCIGNTCVSNVELAKYCVELSGSRSKIVFEGTDAEEKDVWDISTDKAKQYLDYEPLYSIADTIGWILDNAGMRKRK